MNAEAKCREQRLRAQRRISLANPVIRDHRVLGRPLLPGLAYVDLLFQLFRAEGHDHRCLDLRNVSIYRPLALSRDESVLLDIHCTRMQRDRWQITIDGETDRGGSPAGDKRRYLTAEMHEVAPVSFDETLSIEDVAAVARRELALDELYAAHTRQGLVHDAFMRAEGRCYVGDEAVYVDCGLSAVANQFADQLMFHPALIDGSVVCSAAVHLRAEKNREPSLAVPLFYESFRAAELLQRRCLARARTTLFRRSGDLRYCTLEFFNLAGHKIAELKDLASTIVRDPSLIDPDRRRGESPKPPLRAVARVEGPRAEPPEGDVNDAVLDMERFLRQLIADHLGEPVERVAPAARYYELGVESAGMLELVRAIEAKVGVSLPPILLFEHETIRDLAAHLAKRYAGELEARQRAPRERSDESAREVIVSVGVNTRSRSVVPAAQPRASSVGFADVAIIGISGRFPGAGSVEEFWENLAGGKNCVTEVPVERWDYREYFDPVKGRLGKTYCKLGGFIDGVDEFEPLFFGISRREARLMDPREWLFLETVWNLLEGANLTRERIEQEYESRVGVYVGTMYQERLPTAGAMSTKACSSFGSIANRVSNYFGLQGPSIALDVACASASIGVHLACEYLQGSDTRLAIAGGVNLSLQPDKYIGLSHVQLLGSHADSRSFGEGDGYIPAETVAAILLKPLRAAVEDGDPILAVIKGTATNHGGRSSAYGAPSVGAQSRLISSCLQGAGVEAKTISYVEAAATGSPLADAVEVAALAKVFGSSESTCSIGSAKSNIGHAEAASGMSQIIKVVLQLQHGKIVPFAKSRSMNPNIRFGDTPFYLSERLEDWRRAREPAHGEAGEQPRRALINSFAVGGAGASLIVEEHDARHDEIADHEVLAERGPQIVVLSARDDQALRSVVERMCAYVESKPLSLSRLAYTLQVGREAMASRLALVVETRAELVRGLRDWLGGHDSLGEAVPTYKGNLDDTSSAIGALVVGEAGDAFMGALVKQRDHKRIALLWSQGSIVPWRSLHYEAARMINVPTYPFRRERYPFESSPERAESQRPRQPAGDVEPKGLEADVYRHVADFIGTALDLSASEIKPNKSLVDYGMDSILLLKLTRDVHEHYGVKITGIELEDHQSLAKLTRLIERRLAGDDASVSLAGDERDLSFESVETSESPPNCPLSEGQKGLWFQEKRNPSAAAYNVPMCFAQPRDLDIESFRKACQFTLRQHPILNSSIRVENGVPCQRPRAVDAIELVQLDASDLSDKEFENLLRRHAKVPFDLEAGPLIRFSIFGRGAKHYALIVVHHIVFDFVSAGILLRDLFVAYRAYESKRTPKLRATPASYADFVAWEQAFVASDEGRACLEYWRKSLAGAPGNLKLSSEKAAIGTDPASGRTALWALPADSCRALRDFCRSSGINASIFFLGLYQILLCRYCGERDVVIGMATMGRPKSAFDELVGYFVNLLPIRSVIDDRQPIGEFFRALKKTVIEGLERSAYPVQRVLEELSPAADRPMTRMFEVSFSYQNSTMLRGRPDGGPSPLQQLEMIDDLRQEGAFKLVWEVLEADDAFSLCVKYDENHFDHQAIQSLIVHYETLIRGVVGQPSLNVGDYSLMSAAERNRVLYEWNDTEREYPERACVHELIEGQARRSAERVAVSCGEESLTYAELNERANRLARHLRLHGVGPDVLVGLCVERGVQMVVGLLGVLKAGGAYVPLEPSDPAERLEAILRDARPRVLLTQERLKGALGGLAESIVSLDADWREIERQESADLEAAQVGVDAGNLAYVIYTSGSTGVPKGVMVEHRNIVNYATYAALRFAVEEGTGGVVATSVSFDLLLTGLYAPLICGREVRICGEGKDLSSLAKVITQSRELSPVKLTPTHLAMLKESLPKEGWEGGVKTLVLGGEALQAEGLRWWRERSPGTRIFNHYGPTEATVGSVVHEVGEQSSGAVPIGRPINNVRIYILDEQRRPVPIGVVGEIYIGGAGVARGYWQREELTAERFVEDPFSGRGRMYRTGDVGKWRETGEVEFLGRNDQQVKIRGYRIELGEIQARLLEHAAVREAVVLAREDEPGDQRLVAYVVYAEGALEEPSDRAGELRAHLAASLPEYMVPSAYVQLEQLPMTANGKLDRRALPAPGDDAYARATFVPPEGEIEQTLAGIWSELLGVATIGRHDNFFELGGHSLLAIPLLERVRRRLGLGADVRALFTAPTLAGFAATLGAHDEIVAPPNAITADSTRLTPDMLPLIDLTQSDINRIVAETPEGLANIQDIYALSPLQDGILFHHLLATQGDPYLLVSLLAFGERALLDRYVAAFQQIIDRHDILRTAFHWKGLSNPAQVVHRRATLQVTEITLDPERGPAAEQLAQRFDHRHHRLDVSKPPLLRFVFAFDAEQRRWLLLQLRHHLIGDHATSAMLHENVRAILEGRGNALPAPRPFRNLIAQARLGATAEEHERFFRAMLGDIDEPTLPFALADVRRDGDEVAEARRLLPQSLNDRLRAQARRLGVSVASLCHLAWGQVLARASCRETVVFGTVLFGRMQAGEGADMGMGMFLNTLPFRVDLDGTGLEDAVRRTHASLADLLRHEHASLATAQRCSGLSAQTPLFSALLNYRHNRPRPPASAQSSGAPPPPIVWIRGQADNNYPITLSVEDFGQTLGLTAQVVDPLSPERVCGYTQQALESLVEALECAPDTPLQSLEVLPPEERALLLHDRNRTEAPYPEHACVQQLFEAQVARDAGVLALVYQSEALSYGELNARANRLARHLVVLGVRPDDRVGLCMERSLEMVVGLLAVLKAGGAYVPMDPTYPAERLAFMLADSSPALVLTHPRARAALTAATAGLQRPPAMLDLVAEAAGWAGESSTDLSAEALGLDSGHLAYVIYTSGSTGRPKGVMVEHRSVANYLSWAIQTYSLRPGAIAPVNTSLSFDATATSLLAPLCSGGGVSLLPEGPEELIALGSLLAERRRCSLVKLTPAHLDSLGRLEKDAVTNDAADALIIGGEALAAHQVEAWRERAPGTRLINEYGPTETTVGVVTYEIGEATPTSGPIPIGRPIANTRIYLLDRQRRPVPLGAVGEIYIGGAGVARGYLNRPEITAERFIASPFVPGDRLYKTGDLARYLPDGDLLFLGRSDQQVKIRGFRVELGEIEARLAEHGDVREVVVLAREEQSGDKRLVAYVVRAGGALADAGEPGDRAGALRAHLAGCLPDYMVPAAFVELDALPLTANGKVDHKALPAPGEDGYARRAYDPPQGDIEQTLASIWAELLGLEGIGRNDDLFDLGGHSLVAIRLINAIEYRLGIALPLRTVFEKRTLVQLADTLSTYRRHEDAASETEMARILEKIRLVRSTDAASMDTVDKS